MRQKTKRAEMRFIEKQLELLDVVRERREVAITNEWNSKEEIAEMRGRIFGIEEEIKTLTHLLENCAE